MLNRRYVGIACGSLSLTVGAIAWFVGCSVSVGPEGVSGSLTIAGTTVTVGLGQAGLFVVRADTRVTNIADIRPFNETPTDEPASAAVYLRSSSVTVLPDASALKGNVNAQTISGTARLRMSVDARGSASPCTTGVSLGQFDITVQNGVVTSVSRGLYMFLVGVDYFRRNDVSLCLEMESDFDGTIRIEGFDVIFGPSQRNSGSDVRATINVQNISAQNVHVLGPFEEFNDFNRIAPSETRTMGFSNLRINDLITLRAGRDGQVLDSVTCPPVRRYDYVANVEWTGSQLRCVDATPANENDRGACCIPPLIGYEELPVAEAASFYIGCWDMGERAAFVSADDCRFWGGVVQGAETTCATITCDEPFYACCSVEDNKRVCRDLLAGDCRSRIDGEPQSGQVHCDDFPCQEKPASEACCFESGSCDDLPPDGCGLNGGAPKGPGTNCSPNLCPQPAQPKAACCASDGTCTLTTQTACATPGSTFNSGSATCTPNPCPQPAPPVEYLVWYTGNVSCWGAPLIYIDTRDSFNMPGSAASYPGGGIDSSVPLVKTELQGGFASVEEARAWICPQFVSRFSHAWCGSYYQSANCNWQPGALGCDLSALPFTDTLPAGTGCP